MTERLIAVETINMPINEVIKNVKLAGNVYVMAHMTLHSATRIKVNKKSLLYELQCMNDGDKEWKMITELGYSTFDDYSGNPAILLDKYGM